MESLLRRYLWIVDGLVVAMCAIFLAQAAASAVEVNLPLAVPRVAVRAGVGRAAGSITPGFTKEVDEILDRNVFCSTCPPIRRSGLEPDAAPTGNEPPAKTMLPIALMAIMYAPPPHGYHWSVAVIRDTENKGLGSYATGFKVRDAIITEIGETRIYLDSHGKTEFLDLFEAPAAPGAPATPVVAAAASDPLAAEMDRGIKKISDNQYEIQRQTLESVLGNMSLLSRSARIVPEIRDGKAAGFRLYSVRPDGPFAKIGMQNGDVIAAINGLEITSPEKALEVYAKLKSASHLSLGLERNGQRVTKDYNIR